MSDDSRMVKASDFQSWWERLSELAPNDPTANEKLWTVLTISGEAAGALDPESPSGLNPAFNWNGTIDLAPHPLYLRFSRYNPEGMIQEIIQLTGIPESS